MFHKKLHGDLESDFSKEIDEQNSQRNVGNYRNIPKTQKPKKLILISEDELEHQKFNNSQQNIHKDSSRLFPGIASHQACCSWSWGVEQLMHALSVLEYQ